MPPIRAEALLQAQPALGVLVDLARKRLSAREVWLFGSRARGDNHPDSDWDVMVVLPDDAPDCDLDPVLAWRLGHDAGILADVLTERAADIAAASDVVNTLAYAVSREGVRIA